MTGKNNAFIVFCSFFYLLRWAKFSSQCSGNGLDGATDGSGEDEVTVEVLTSGLVGCVLVGSLVVRPHTLSTCGEEQSHRQMDTC